MTDKEKNANSPGFTIWITGLPYTGKKKTGAILAERLNLLGYKTELLIGGEIRRLYEKELGFSKEEVRKNVQRIAFECHLLSENEVIAIAVTISPYRDIRQEARKLTEKFVEVYFRCPLEILKERDEKGLFKKAEEGLLENVAGITIPYEESEEVEVIIEADKEAPFQAANKIFLKLQELGFLTEEKGSILLKQEEHQVRKILRDTWFK